MDVETHTAATISEIDRTLRSLGLRDDYAAPPRHVLPPKSPPPPAVAAASARRTMSTQTHIRARQSTGVQKSPSVLGCGTQHTPKQHATSCQTGPEVDASGCLDEFSEFAQRVNALVESGLATCEGAADKAEELSVKLARIEKRAWQAANCLRVLQEKCDAQFIELEEASARGALFTSESDGRGELVSVLCTEWLQLATSQRETNLQSAISVVPRELHVLGEVPHLDSRKDSPSDSLNDLTELLDECWRVLDE